MVSKVGKWIETIDGYVVDDEQLSMLEYIDEVDTSILTKHRQFGMTTCLAAYALYTALTNQESNIFIISPHHHSSVRIVSIIEELFRMLVNRDKGIITKSRMDRLFFTATNSRIHSIAESDMHQIRGHSINLLIVDGKNLMQEFDEFERDDLPVFIARGNMKLIMAST
jgi:hypothetical protein